MIIGSDEQSDFLRYLDRDSLDSVQLTNRALRVQVEANLQGECLRVLTVVSLKRRLERGDICFQVLLNSLHSLISDANV